MVFAVVLAVAVPDQGPTGWEPGFIRHCEPTGRRKALPDDRLREAIHSCEESVDCFVATLLGSAYPPCLNRASTFNPP